MSTPPRSSIGTALRTILRRETGLPINRDVDRFVASLNWSTPADIKAALHAQATELLQGLSVQDSQVYRRIVALAAANEYGLSRYDLVEDWLQQACFLGAGDAPRPDPSEQYEGHRWRSAHPGAIDMAPRELVVGVITCNERMPTLLVETLSSLRAAGFTIDRLFCDGRTPWECDVPTTVRECAAGPAGNWLLAAVELLTRFPAAQRFALFQDDCRAVAGLAGYLAGQPMPERGWWNLITHPSNESLPAAREGCGWFASNQAGHGAVGLMFSAAGLQALLTSDLLWASLRRPSHPCHIDHTIARALAKAGWTEYCHAPSLLQHVGTCSTLRADPWPERLSVTFPGEQFDAARLPRQDPA